MNKIREKIINTRSIRMLIQVAGFIAFTGLFTLIYGSLKSLYICTMKGNFDLTASIPQLIIITVIFLTTILFGRFFCGWICAFGTLMDFLHFISYKITRKKIIVNHRIDNTLKYLKYVVLAMSIIFIWTLGMNLFEGSNPWDVFGTYTSLGDTPSLTEYMKSNWVGAATLAVIMAGGLFIERFFCRYLCPLGALFTILSKFRIMKIRKEKNHCGKCNICSESCSMGIYINPIDIVHSGECINCLKCIHKCPGENLNTSVGKKQLSKRIITALAVFTLLLCAAAYYGATYIDSIQTSDSGKANISELTKQSTGTYQDGTYEGTGTGFKGTTTVSVTIKNGYITDIATVSTNDDKPYYNRAFSSMVQQIISTQNVGVDSVTGATFSSNGIRNAVADALGQEYQNNNDQIQRGHSGPGSHGEYGKKNGTN
ncbi:4Fe-4S binding protein [Aminipila terrae]|uniref:4Fe-4S binding protein n=1 Tax=Aminipila terrae TaxID=2697030 RepID=A0A6P1MNH0_9FIRM|nr:4Fe-4S binding protein [Aminipila terrae]QHI72555.1 4Fe-4S binding protein [Aminipila terrae]